MSVWGLWGQWDLEDGPLGLIGQPEEEVGV